MEQASALITLLVYAIVLLLVGVWSARRAKTQESFLLGDRSLGPIVSGIAYAASSSSAWVLLGYSGFVYSAGVSAIWMIPGIMAGYVLVWFWLGPMLQSASAERGHLTLTSFLADTIDQRFGKPIRVCASLMIAFCFSYYVASQFQGAGLAFDDLFGTGLAAGVILGAVIILIYTFLGGFLAVSLIDTLQGMLMAVVAIALPVIALLQVGGFGELSAAIADAGPAYTDTFGERTGYVATGFAIGLVATGFGALGQPHLLAWIMATKDRKARVTGGMVAISWATVVFTGMTLLGLSARALFGSDAPAEGVFFQIAGDYVPTVFAGIIVAATLSAIMSTVDSQLLVVGASISEDLGLSKRFPGRDVLISRMAILSVSIIAIILTLMMPATIFDRTLFAWTTLGSAFAPTLIARVLGFKPLGIAVLSSTLIGCGLSILFEFVLPSGPGAVWARTLPLLAASVPVFLVTAKQRNIRPSIDAGMSDLPPPPRHSQQH